MSNFRKFIKFSNSIADFIESIFRVVVLSAQVTDCHLLCSSGAGIGRWRDWGRSVCFDLSKPSKAVIIVRFTCSFCCLSQLVIEQFVWLFLRQNLRALYQLVPPSGLANAATAGRQGFG